MEAIRAAQPRQPRFAYRQAVLHRQKSVLRPSQPALIMAQKRAEARW